ncbi:sugar ABC transporter, sugar-binding protein [Candidatus Moduliflexus flocculans]|uniref:Sugar ABC transporter, sugar-binding protein n=1 Tax=Candidatus Moduliflexus flocculans TaxID=1499966 RepID=A0A0S6VTG0_9BACT|nr:sugar ABC transporter, sugar-binding protein [Candidatus Moduliflexus flocculans]
MRRVDLITIWAQRMCVTPVRIRQSIVWQRRFCIGVVCLALTGCVCWNVTVHAADVPTPADNQETYAMISFGWGREFFAWSFAGMSDAAALLGPHVKVEWHGPPPDSQEPAALEANILKAMIKRNVAGIIVSAAEKNMLKPAINDAIEAGIPVICFDSDVPESQRLAIVATDNYRAGYLAGTTMAEWLNGSVGVVTINNVIHLEERMRGFRAGIASISPDTQIFIIEEEAFGPPDSNLVADYKILLKAHPDIKGLFALWATTGIAAANAVRELNLTGAIQILSFDFDTATIQAIEQDDIRATVAQNPYLMGYYSLLLAYSAAHPTGIPSSHPGFGHVPAAIDTGVTIIGKDDIAQYKHVPKVEVTQEPPLIYEF